MGLIGKENEPKHVRAIEDLTRAPVRAKSDLQVPSVCPAPPVQPLALPQALGGRGSKHGPTFGSKQPTLTRSQSLGVRIQLESYPINAIRPLAGIILQLIAFTSPPEGNSSRMSTPESPAFSLKTLDNSYRTQLQKYSFQNRSQHCGEYSPCVASCLGLAD